jgi:hypothetical protein
MARHIDDRAAVASSALRREGIMALAQVEGRPDRSDLDLILLSSGGGEICAPVASS